MQAVIRHVPDQDADHKSQDQDTRADILDLLAPDKGKPLRGVRKLENLPVRTFLLRFQKGSADRILQLLPLVAQGRPHRKVHLFLKAVFSAGQHCRQFHLLGLILRIVSVENTSVRIKDCIAAALPAERKRLDLQSLRHDQRGSDPVCGFILAQQAFGKLPQDLLCPVLCLFLCKLPGMNCDRISPVICVFPVFSVPVLFICSGGCGECADCQLTVRTSALLSADASALLQDPGGKRPHMHGSCQHNSGKEQQQ